MKGQDIIVTDGNTLLGADDKAGISVLLYLMHNLKVNKNLKHGPLKIISLLMRRLVCHQLILMYKTSTVTTV